ncbi:5-aminolevulic acid synthase [Roseicitreum antarcticum]|nr:5-aminolevulic acid synthase [Roseicitreum antarcticum]
MKCAYGRSITGRALAALLPIAMLPGAALAQTLSGAEVEGQLFAPEQAEVVIYDTSVLSAENQAIVTQIAQGQKYYAAMALAPDHGLLHQATVLAANYHDVAAARAAALRECDSLRESDTPCLIVLEVRPAGWTARDLQLNADATAAFTRDYLPARAPKAMALSPATGQWAIGQGAAALDDARAACADAAAPAGDCAVRIAD